MFKSNNTGDNVTREEATGYVEGLDRKIAALRAEGVEQLSRIDSRLRSLEGLAAQMRRTQSMSNAAPLPVRAPFQGVTKAEATEAYNHLLQAGEAKFNELGARLDQVVSLLAEEYDDEETEGVTASTVDYGAVAFGLSQIKQDVSGVLRDEVRTADLAENYRQTVQYFADVFAKSDPTFDADAFKRQAGV